MHWTSLNGLEKIFMPKGRYDPTTPAEVGRRLALTRRALEYTTTTMCRLMGSISHGSAYSNYESGIRLIHIQHALKLCSKCRLTLGLDLSGRFQEPAARHPRKDRGAHAAGRRSAHHP
jgi:transcriptional regulator with XRE-family HTH domain